MVRRYSLHTAKVGLNVWIANAVGLSIDCKSARWLAE